MYIKVHKIDDKKVVAICDEGLIGKEFEENGLQLKVTERFYKGSKVNEKDALQIVKGSSAINIVGEESIKFALKNKLISKENIQKVKGIKHAQVF